ncbi:cellulose synthase/poly-beta-1,6-N-acetylglucosamine synthase-like glycosyltransferase [Tumebacillus sp. BK434]|uniref:glycosyltransferase n=1 Tax=Tumebacillus sp. BK434 TaxID=2512169 RepID=UPI00104E2A2B|nr:glycosyltransferase family 2 protein [Tumebacillus sp. BK434]TCP53360.1 cellulose synthase/poly-beta-1,6-N-acetylglucosamine synthase-like glycosyltransferase [Tumebacillus sp. BK434]
MVFLQVMAVLVCVYWVVMLVLNVRGLKMIPELTGGKVSGEEPFVSVIVAGKDEEAAIERTVESLLALEYRNYELIVVNDRSEDRTGEILDAVQQRAKETGSQVRFNVIHIETLPEGWLGKNHALYQGYQQASGEYMLFTDADVRFERNALGAAMAYAVQERADHVTMTPTMEASRFWLRAFVHYFLFSLCLLIRPWLPNVDTQDKVGFGIGAFNLISREAYEQIGTHKELRMRPDDDLQLGTMVKRAGLKQRLVTGTKLLTVEWYPTLGAAIRGLEKNTFAGLNYSLLMVLIGVLGQLFAFFLPFVGWLLLGWAGLLYAASVVMMIYLYLQYTRTLSPYRGEEVIALPLTALLFVYIIVRSTYLTLRQGGIYWRGTFYPLKELKRMKQGRGIL